MRRLLALSSTLFLTLGCGKDDESEAKAECQLEAIDLSACQRSSLAQVQADGIWNLNVLLNDGAGAASTMRLTGLSSGAALLGFNVTERQVSGDTFFLASDVVSGTGNPVRYVVAGCSATGPGQLGGIFRRCVDGQADLQGTFEGVRLSRRAGEEESSKVERVGEIALPRGSATELAVAHGHAYVVAGREGLFIFDVSNPSQPTKVLEAKPSNDVYNDVLVHGQTMYVATKSSGIAVFDLTDPKTPARIRSVPEKAVEAVSLAVDGNYLYAASPAPNAEVLIFDITKPTEPKVITRYFVEGSEPNAGELPLDVTAAGGKLYVSHWTYGMTVSDVTTPTKPKLLGRFAGATSRTTVVGTFGARTVAFDAGEDWGAHLSVLNVTVPELPEQMGAFRTRPEVSIRSMALSGTKLYVAYYQDGLRVLDVSVPGEPRQVGYYNSWRETDAGRGVTFFDGLNALRVPGDGYIYATETARGLLIFRETE
ncbi:LVIVD repeat-containing protein [Pyxidicoccus sp. 3LFB2]